MTRIDPTAEEADFGGLERALAARWPDAVTGGLEPLIDDDCIEFGASGKRWTRQEILRLLGDETAREVTIEDLEVLRLAADVRLVTYRASVAGRTSLRSSLWVRRAGRWRLRFHQGTPAETEA